MKKRRGGGGEESKFFSIKTIVGCEQPKMLRRRGQAEDSTQRIDETDENV